MRAVRILDCRLFKIQTEKPITQLELVLCEKSQTHIVHFESWYNEVNGKGWAFDVGVNYAMRKMQYYSKFYGLARTKVDGALERAIAKENVNTTAKKRETIVLFYRNNDYKLTQGAYDVKWRTLLNWQNKYKEYGINGLIYGNRAPKHKRRSKISQEMKDFI